MRILLLVVVAIGVAQWWQTREQAGAPAVTDRVTPAAPVEQRPATMRGDTSRHPSFLPAEAIATVELIERGGPYPYQRDGSVFQNREHRLPERPRGYYREYTVPTPGSRDRGARRIVSGGDPPEVYYYTDDHYRTFQRVEVQP